jgi:putative protease
MIRHIPELVAAGISSFKIEGRMKSEYYVATTAKIYRTAIDKYFDDPDSYTFDESWLSELQKISHRGYTTGFYFGKPDKNSQNYETSSYIRNYDLIGIVESYDPKLKQAKILQKNRFFVGDEVEVFPPVGKFFTQKIEKIVNEAGENLDVANRPHDVVTINMDQPVQPGTMLRKKVEDN